MSKITFIGAGSAVFAKNVLGDCMLTEALQDFELALYDIDLKRLRESEQMLTRLGVNVGSTCRVKAYEDRVEALRGADYVINAILVGGDEACRTDFNVPKKYGLGQTIGDTVGIGGIFRSLRTIPAMMELAADMRKVCPNALLLNYTNPMAILTIMMNVHGGVQTVGLCHSVQGCVPKLFQSLGMDAAGVEWKIAGINHMAWLLEVTRDGVDLYPEVKRRAAEKQSTPHRDMVRFEIMRRFGCYVTESSIHHAEYHPYFIKRSYPELINQLQIPLDDYLERRRKKAAQWQKTMAELLDNAELKHTRTSEYGSYIMEAIVTNRPFRIAGNVMNTGLIANLPQGACVEVPCLVDGNGVAPTVFGELPTHLAALNMSHINMQLLTVEAAVTGKKEHIYQAAFLDPHTSAELSLDDIVALCDELIEAHGSLLPAFR
ncbi:MAG: melA [Paenibacillaceae bacterium]|nr:melA [Paenibacillaceae bacterium]